MSCSPNCSLAKMKQFIFRFGHNSKTRPHFTATVTMQIVADLQRILTWKWATTLLHLILLYKISNVLLLATD